PGPVRPQVFVSRSRAAEGLRSPVTLLPRPRSVEPEAPEPRHDEPLDGEVEGLDALLGAKHAKLGVRRLEGTPLLEPEHGRLCGLLLAPREPLRGVALKLGAERLGQRRPERTDGVPAEALVADLVAQDGSEGRARQRLPPPPPRPPRGGSGGGRGGSPRERGTSRWSRRSRARRAAGRRREGEDRGARTGARGPASRRTWVGGRRRVRLLPRRAASVAARRERPRRRERASRRSSPLFATPCTGRGR